MDEILIVDDEQFIRDVLSEYLNSSYSCATAASAEEAKKLLTSAEFKLVLTDIVMPGASGLDLLDNIKAHHPRILVIMVSTDLDSARQGVRRGAFDYIVKPFDLPEVRRVVERALSKWAES